MGDKSIRGEFGLLSLQARWRNCFGIPEKGAECKYFAVASFGMISLLELLADNFADLTGRAGRLSLLPGDRLMPAY